MQEVDKDIVELIKTLGQAVEDLPVSVQPSAFQFLLDYHLHGEIGATSELAQVAVAAPSAGDWAKLLASESGATSEEIQCLLSRDEEGFHVNTPEIGTKEVERLRNISVLLLWAHRVIERDIYVPQSEISRVVRELGLSSKNMSNALRRADVMKPITVRGEKMVQLVGEWENRAHEIVQEFAQ